MTDTRIPTQTHQYGTLCLKRYIELDQYTTHKVPKMTHEVPDTTHEVPDTTHEVPEIRHIKCLIDKAGKSRTLPYPMACQLYPTQPD